MNKKLIALAAAAAVLTTTAACTRRDRTLPPDPPSSEVPGGQDDSGVTDPGIGSTPLPGSRGDFMQSVPSDRVFFDFDSYSLDAEDRQTLDSQAAWLNRNASVRVTIEGHADERGTREYNLALGERRANAARDYLQARGVAASRMTVISWGKERPSVEGSNEYAWSQNRRAVTVVPE